MLTRRRLFLNIFLLIFRPFIPIPLRGSRSRSSRHFSLKGLPSVVQHYVLSRPFAELSALLPKGTSFGSFNIASSVGRSRSSRHFFGHYVLSRPFAELTALLRTLRPQSAVRGAHGTSSDITSSVATLNCACSPCLPAGRLAGKQ